MRSLKAIASVVASLTLSACGTADGVATGAAGSESLSGSGHNGNAPTSGSSGAEAANATTQPAALSALELARVEFSDGNVVQFESIEGGVLISELGPAINPPHLTPRDGLTALEAFKALAPDRSVPAALLRAHERMYPAGAKLVAAPKELASEKSAPASELPFDANMEHNGEFQQATGSLPAATFLKTWCDFTTTDGLSYKHTSRTDTHNDISLKIHSAYSAHGADIGIITAQVCFDVDKTPNNCNAIASTNPGFARTFTWDGGLSCSSGGGVTICIPRQVRLDIRYGKVSSSVRFHDCAKLFH